MLEGEISDDALRFWGSFFRRPGNTLRFGGVDAKMGITPAARTALNELILVGAVEPTEPDDQIINREHYIATDLDLVDEIKYRAGDDPFTWLADAEFVAFERIRKTQT